MKFIIDRNLFLKNVNNVLKAISSNTAIPILKGIKIDLSENTLTLTGSDTNISIKIDIPKNEDLHIESTGSIVLPARFFSEIIKKLPGKDFSFEVKDSFQTKIMSENSDFTINGLDADNYPKLPEITRESSFVISGKSFKEVISETVFAVANQENRPILNGVNFDFNPKEINAIATDSHRLSRRTLKLATGPAVATNLVIPGNSLIELSKIIADDDPQVTVIPGENQVLFKISNINFYTRLLEGSYPDTERLIPQEATTTVELDALTLARSLERVSLLAHESRNNVVKMYLNVEDQIIKLSGDSAEVGNVAEELAFDSLNGENLEISFNPDYLRDALRVSITDSIVIKFTKPLRPFVVVPKDSDEKFIQLITPVRTF